VPCNTGPDEICEFVLDSDDKKSAKQVLKWLNSWWTTTANDVPPPDECGPVARALCQCFALQHDKHLVCQPGLTGFSFSEEVCVCVFARDDLHPLAHPTYEWEARELFCSPLQSAQEAERIKHQICLIRGHLPIVVTPDDWQGPLTFVLGNCKKQQHQEEEEEERAKQRRHPPLVEHMVRAKTKTR
jgi:hypothetical protein